MNYKYIIFLKVVPVLYMSIYSYDAPTFKLETPFKKTVPFTVTYDASSLHQAVDHTAYFLKALRTYSSKHIKVDVNLFSSCGITLDDVEDTLNYMAHIIAENPQVLQDITFLEKHFDFYRWYVASDKPQELHGHFGYPDYIRTTHYLIPHCKGYSYKHGEYNVPLYAVPYDEKKLTPSEINDKRNELIRFRYGRSEIMQGVLHTSLQTKILGWITLADYKELVMQGSMYIEFENGKTEICSIIKHNHKLADESYWYSVFKDVTRDPKKTKYPIKPDPVPGITLAGNIKDIGFGKLFFIVSHTHNGGNKEGRFGLLTDTGRAFEGNFRQVDMFTGYFQHRKEFQEHIACLPHSAQMYIMIKKRPPSRAIKTVCRLQAQPVKVAFNNLWSGIKELL